MTTTVNSDPFFSSPEAAQIKDYEAIRKNLDADGAAGRTKARSCQRLTKERVLIMKNKLNAPGSSCPVKWKKGPSFPFFYFLIGSGLMRLEERGIVGRETLLFRFFRHSGTCNSDELKAIPSFFEGDGLVRCGEILSSRFFRESSFYERNSLNKYRTFCRDQVTLRMCLTGGTRFLSRC